MTGLSRRSLLFGGLLAMASAGAFALEPRRRIDYRRGVPLARMVPERFGPWHHEAGGGFVLPPEEARQQGENRYDQELSRIYVDEQDNPVMLLIAYGSTQSDTLQVHRPEFCYPASGFQMGPARHIEVATAARRVPASFFTGVRGDRVEHILYWTRLGEYFPVTWLGQHWSRVENSFDGVLPDGILVRMSVIGGNADDALPLLQRFATDLVAAIPQKNRPVLIGTRAELRKPASG